MDYYKETEIISKKLLAFNLGLVALIVVMFFKIYDSTHTKPKEIVANVIETVAQENPFDNIELGAKSAYVYDVANQKVIYKKNEFVQLPLASLTKLMMALTAVELLPKDSTITIKKEFLQEEGDSGLFANESWRLKDLLDYSLVISSNDGARSIASVIGATKLGNNDYDLGRKEFVTQMNLKAKELGLKQTYFVNENGLDIGEVSGGYGSAIDISKLMQYMLAKYPDVLEVTKYKNIEVDSETKTHKGKNTNIEIGKIPGLLASKTGFTDMAGGNLAIAFDPSIGHPIVVVVMGSTLEGRFDDVSKLVQASIKYAQLPK